MKLLQSAITMLGTFALGLLLGGSVVCAGEVTSPKPAAPPRAGDELWLINSREWGEAEGSMPKLEMRRFDVKGEEKWPIVDAAPWLEPAKSEMSTIVFIHGYGYSDEDALAASWLAYHAIAAETPKNRPLRFVIYSWPSTAKRFRGLRDFGDKGRRTFSDAWYLANILAKFPANEKISLIGCSYGARIVTGATHLLGGGELRDLKLTDQQLAARPQFRALLLAPALHNDWLYPDNLEDKSIGRLERLMLLYNTQDPVLTQYARLSRSSDPEALGLSGFLELDRLGALKDRVEQIDTFKFIDDHHGLQHYFGSSELMQKIRPFTLWTDGR